MSQLHGNIQMLTNSDLDKFVEIIATKVEAKIMANQQKRDIQSQITKAMRIEAIKFDMGSRYSTPASMIPVLDKHMAKAEALIGQAAERMNGELAALREKLLKEIPMPNHAAYRSELLKAREAAQKRLEDGIAAASGSISEVDHLTSVVGLQSRMIGGASLEQLLSELGSYRELNSLALLAEQRAIVKCGVWSRSGGIPV